MACVAEVIPADNVEAKEGMNEDKQSDSDADTSSWESEPNTARSTRQYHPVKGERSTLFVDEEADSQPQPSLTNGDRVPPTERHSSGEPELLSSQGLRRTYGLDDAEVLNRYLVGSEALDPARQPSSSEEDEEEEEAEEGTKLPGGRRGGGRAETEPSTRAGKSGSSGTKHDDPDSEEVLEELDLTRERESVFEVFDRMPPGMPQAQFVFVPSSGPFGADSLSTLMSSLLTGEGLENDADVSSQSEAEVTTPRDRRGGTPEGDGSEQQRWEHLMSTLERQHRQQVVLQREHHQRQVHLLQAQLAGWTREKEGLVGRQQEEPLGLRTVTLPTSNVPRSSVSSEGGDEEPQTMRRSPKGREERRGDGNLDPEMAGPPISRVREGLAVGSSDSESTLEGSSLDVGDEMLMTTWSSMAEQRQAQTEKGRTPRQTDGTEDSDRQETKPPRDSSAREDDDRFAALKSHFAEQQEQLESQYAQQVRNMQQQWSALQQQQREQQEVLSHLLSRQHERLSHAQQGQTAVAAADVVAAGSLDQTDADQIAAKDCGSPISDDTSTSYSDFTYWKQAEGDTYQALPDLSANDSVTDQCQQQALQQAGVHSRPAALLQPVGEVSGRSPSPIMSAENSEAGEDRQRPESNRMNLREKHARHVADLKAYYEAEIQELQSRLDHASAQRDPSAEQEAGQTSRRLQDRCLKLEAALKLADSRTEDLENTVKALEERLAETYDTTGSSVANLQSKVNNLKQLSRHKELDVQSLEKRNRELQASLDQAYQLQDAKAMDEQKEQTILKKVVAEYQALAKKHTVTKELLHDTETQLYESKAKICDLTRTLAHLEVDVKRMDLDHSFSKRYSLLKSPRGGTSPRQDARPSPVSPTGAQQESRETGHQTAETVQAVRREPTESSTPVASVIARSVEDRKFLKSSTNYSPFTGEELVSENGTASQGLPSDTESSLSQPDPPRMTTNRPSSLEVPMDVDTDEERPLSPMMKAARQFDLWRFEESLNAGSSRGGLSSKFGSTSQNGGHFEDGSSTDEQIQETTSRHHNRSGDHPLRGEDEGALTPRRKEEVDSLTADGSIHIWPAQKSPSSTRSSSKPGRASVPSRSSPKQFARQSLARAIKPRDHDLFPVRGSTGEGQRSEAVSTRSPDSAPRKTNPSPRKRLFVAEDVRKGRTIEAKDKFMSLLSGKGDASSARPNQETASSRDHTPKSRPESGHDIIKRIEEHRKRLDELVMEKRQLETTLSHGSTAGRVSRQWRQEEERLEQRLEHVTREVNSVRMLLRKYNALKSSI